MRLGIMLPDAGALGGVTEWSVFIARELRPFGIDAELVAMGELDEQRRQDLTKQSASVVRSTNVGRLASSIAVTRLDVERHAAAMRNWRYDVILPNWSLGSYAVAARVAQLGANSQRRANQHRASQHRAIGPHQTRIVGTVHSDSPDYYSWIRRYANHMTHVIAVSDEITAKLRADTSVDPGEIIELPYALPVTQVAARRDPNRTTVVYCGRLESGQKRFQDVLTVAKRVLRANASTVFQFVGDGPDAKMLAAWTASLPPADACRVEVRGALSRDAALQVVAAADIFLLASAYEGTSIAMLEAMALGVIPVVTRVSGVAAEVKDATNGYVREVGQTRQMADAILGLAADPCLRRQLSAACVVRSQGRMQTPAYLSQLAKTLASAGAAPAPDTARTQPPLPRFRDLRKRDVQEAFTGNRFAQKRVAAILPGSVVQSSLTLHAHLGGGFRRPLAA